MTQKAIIIRYLQELNDWFPAYRLRGLQTPFGFAGHQADRRAGELAQEGKIQHKIENGFAFYKAEPLKFKEYKVEGLDKIVKLFIK